MANQTFNQGPSINIRMNPDNQKIVKTTSNFVGASDITVEVGIIRDKVNYLGTLANTSANDIVIIQGVDLTQNTDINNVNIKTQAVFDLSNTSSNNIIIIQGVDSTQNDIIAIIQGVDSTQNVDINNLISWLNANVSFISGVNSTQNTNINTIQGVDNTQNTNITNTVLLAQSAFDKANTDANNVVVIQGVDLTQNNSITIIQGVDLTQNTNITNTGLLAQAAFDKANSTPTNPVDQYARDTSNTAANNITIIQGVDLTQNNSITIIQGVDLTQNTSITTIQGVDLTQNTNITNAGLLAQASFGVANTAANNVITIQGVDLTQNTNITTIQGVDLTQNNTINAVQNTLSRLSIANNKIFTVNNTITLTGTDGSTLNISSGGILGTSAFVPAIIGIYTVTNSSISKTLTSGEFSSFTLGSLTATLPASPSVGTIVGIGTGNYFTTTVGRNSQLIMSLAQDMTIDKANAVILFCFVGGTIGWELVDAPTTLAQLAASVFGTNKQIAFNDNGIESGASTLTWDKSSSTLALNGVAKFGDGGSTNYISISSNGTMTLNGTASLPVASIVSNSDQMVLAAQVFS